jgi:hypothetical protein
MVLEQHRPSSRTEAIDRVNASHANGKVPPLSVLELRQDFTPIYRIAVLGVKSQSYERREYYHSRDQLSLVHCRPNTSFR